MGTRGRRAAERLSKDLNFPARTPGLPRLAQSILKLGAGGSQLFFALPPSGLHCAEGSARPPALPGAPSPGSASPPLLSFRRGPWRGRARPSSAAPRSAQEEAGPGGEPGPRGRGGGGRDRARPRPR